MTSEIHLKKDNRQEIWYFVTKSLTWDSFSTTDVPQTWNQLQWGIVVCHAQDPVVCQHLQIGHPVQLPVFLVCILLSIFKFDPYKHQLLRNIHTVLQKSFNWSCEQIVFSSPF